MNARGTSLTGQPGDHRLELLFLVATRQDEVGKFIEYKNKKRHIGSALAEAVVKTHEPLTGKQLVTLVHLDNGVAQYRECRGEINRHWSPQVDTVSNVIEGQYLRIDQPQPQVLRRIAPHDARDK